MLPMLRIIGIKRKNGPDRHRKLERDCLEISVISRRAIPLGFGDFMIRVGVYHGGFLTLGTSNYRMSMENGPD